MVFVRVSVSCVAPNAVSVTLKNPVAVYTCTGLASVLVNPSPKSHR